VEVWKPGREPIDAYRKALDFVNSFGNPGKEQLKTKTLVDSIKKKLLRS